MILALLLGVLSATSAAAQSPNQHGIRIGQIQAASLAENGDASRAEFETWVEQLPVDYAEVVSAGFAGIERQGAKTTIHRFVRDNFRHVYVGYTVTVEVLRAGTYRASFGGSQVAMDALPAGWTTISLAHYPVPQMMEDGDLITLHLYADGSTGRELVEYIHAGKQPHMTPRNEPAHDSYSDDAEFAITLPRVRTNGVAQEAAGLPKTLRSPTLRVSIPGHGNYILSFKPTLGFVQAGEVAGNSLTFSVDANVFRIECAERIASAGSGTYRVYALAERANPETFTIESTR